MTLFCDLHVKDDAVVAVDPAGAVRGLRPGDTAVVASYHGLLASAKTSVSSGRVVVVPDVPESDEIDREVFAKLRSLGIAPSGASSDAEFLRRVTLDAIGTLPTPAEVREFLADRASDKRTRKIDALLAHPMHAALWATRFLDITGCDVRIAGGPRRPEASTRPDVARLVPQAYRREHALRPDRAGCPLRRPAETARTWPVARARRRRGWTRRRSAGRPTTRPGRAWICSGAGSRRTASISRSSRWPSARPPRSWACGSSAPSATSTRSTAGPRPTTARSPTSSPRSASASLPMAWPRRRG